MAPRVIYLCAFLMFGALLETCYGGGLSSTFYNQTCPSVETLVRSIVERTVKARPAMAAKLLRMHFHDCFVRGCDGSVLLDSTSVRTPAEKDAFPSLSIGGFDIIADIKTRIEQECSGVVSCADIVALAARDAVATLNPKVRWEVLMGRRDGRESKASDVNSFNLPPGTANFTFLLNIFKRKGLNVVDLVALSGAHTIGVTHCRNLRTRLYNFTGTGGTGDTDDTDLALDPDYAITLKEICSIDDNPSTSVDMDPGSPKSFDGNYYKILRQNKGIFRSDAALLTDPTARMLVRIMRDASTFYDHFRASMEKLGSVQVLTGAAGEIRRDCSVVN